MNLIFVAISAAIVAHVTSGSYFAITSKGNFASAAWACHSSGGTLAAFHNDTEFQAAQAVCKSTCETYDPTDTLCGCWVGLMDMRAEGAFSWMDGSAQDYLVTSSGAPYTGVYPWYSGEPNNYANEDCVHIWKPQSYLLNDIYCTSGAYYAVCQSGQIASADFFAPKSQGTYKKAGKVCAKKGGALASFQTDSQFVVAQGLCESVCTAKDSDNGLCGCWVGLSDKGNRKEGKWSWADKSKRSFAMAKDGTPTTGVWPWYPGEPNDYANEDCAHIWKAQGWLLNDIACTADGYFPVCEGAGAAGFEEEEEEDDEVMWAHEREHHDLLAVLDAGDSEVAAVTRGSSVSLLTVGVPVLAFVGCALLLMHVCDWRGKRKGAEHTLLLEAQEAV